MGTAHFAISLVTNSRRSRCRPVPGHDLAANLSKTVLHLGFLQCLSERVIELMIRGEAPLGRKIAFQI